jgi:hypothetical protein
MATSLSDQSCFLRWCAKQPRLKPGFIKYRRANWQNDSTSDHDLLGCDGFTIAILEIPMCTQTACEALRSGHVLRIEYDGYTRDVEVHAVGFTKDDNPIMRVWQVAGGSVSNEPVGWKLLRLDEATSAVVTHQRSLAPRAGYNPGDPVMSVITCQL